ncbi:MAG: hypothetical protein WD872_01575 [Pirellulaceae bacterium]
MPPASWGVPSEERPYRLPSLTLRLKRPSLTLRLKRPSLTLRVGVARFALRVPRSAIFRGRRGIDEAGTIGGSEASPLITSGARTGADCTGINCAGAEGATVVL